MFDLNQLATLELGLRQQQAADHGRSIARTAELYRDTAKDLRGVAAEFVDQSRGVLMSCQQP